jgi:hypothetical protein
VDDACGLGAAGTPERYIKSRARTPPHRVADLLGKDFAVNRKNSK